MSLPQGLTASKSVGRLRTFGVGMSRLMTFSMQGDGSLSNDGRKSEKELPALAAQLRAFSSLLSLPSQAQSVIKAFRRQGIGSADVFNTARFFLSRLESLSALLQVFQIFRGRAELAASRPMARQCDLFRYAPQIPQTRLTHASTLGRSRFLV